MKTLRIATGSNSKNRKSWNITLLTLLIFLFYAFSTTSDGLSYNAYLDAILAGRLNVTPEASGDVSLYQGKYYLYFGIAPVLTVMLPWKILTGATIPRGNLVFIFVFAIFLVSKAILTEFFEFHKLSRRTSDYFWCCVALGLCNLSGYFLRFSAIYEAAISSAVFWTLMCSWFGMKYYHSQEKPKQKRLLGWMSLFAGLAVASRYSYFLATPGILSWVFLATYFQKETQTNHKPKEKFKELVYLFGPFGAIFLALLSMNYIRFGNPLDFGTKHMLAAIWKFPGVFIGIGNVWANFCLLFLNHTRISEFFPFVDAFNSYYWAHPNFSHRDPQPVVNIFFAAPFTLLLFLSVYWALRHFFQKGPRNRSIAPLSFFVFLFLIPGAVNLSVLLISPAMTMRYLMDFLPFFLLIACFGFITLRQKFKSRPQAQIWITAFSRLSIAWGVIFGLAMSMSGHTLGFKHTHPIAYQRVEKAFEWITALTFRESQYGPLQVAIQFPESSAQLLPVVVTGRSGWDSNALYVKYTGPKKIVLGLHPGDLVSKEIEIDPKTVYQMEVTMGSLYPNGHLGSLWIKGLSHCLHSSIFDPVPRFLEERGFQPKNYKQLRVKLNGEVLLEGETEFFPSKPSEVRLGFHPDAKSLGWSSRFTGILQSAGRVPFLAPKSKTL